MGRLRGLYSSHHLQGARDFLRQPGVKRRADPLWHRVVALAGRLACPDARFWREAAEKAGVLVFHADNVDVKQDMRGLSLAEKPLPAVVLNVKDSYAARSFSLFHELAHVALGRGGICDLEETLDTEAFCNHVAGAALIPAALLLRQPETPRTVVSALSDEVLFALARRFGSSAETVLRRLVLVKRVSPDFYRRKRPEFLAQYEGLAQKEKRGFGSPALMAVSRAGPLFTRLVVEAFDEERITASDVSDFLAMQLKHLGRVREAVGPKNKQT